MVRLVPEEPNFVTQSEREVWQRLRDQLGDDDVLMAGVWVTDTDGDYEADLVVAMPGTGICVIEVKGAGVCHDDDGWWMEHDGERRPVDPVAQARKAKHGLKRHVEHQPRWGSRGHVAWGHGVITPYTAFGPDFQLPDLPRWALQDKNDLDTLVGRLRRNLTNLQHGQRPPDHDDVEALVDALTGPVTVPAMADYSDERAAALDHLTDEQAMLLRVTRLLHRVEVRGGAGSGKTVLALQQAKELTRGGNGRPGQRVALLCYSIGLAEFLKTQVESWDRRHRPAFVGTYHEFGRQWGAPEGERTDSAFWEEELPRLMADLAAEQPHGKKYDAIVVDEAQDFADSWWAAVTGALRDEEQGGLYVFSDENQRIFGRFGRPPVPLVPLVLDHNLRNTKQIHEAFGPLAPSRMYSRGGEGPEVRFVPCASDEALEVADDEVDSLLDAGWEPGHVALVTTGKRHPVQVERTDFHGQVGYWKTWWHDEVFYGHVLGCKGLERRAVVLCVNETGSQDRGRERLYVGMSRATDVLVVVGDPTVIETMGGPSVARRLGITQEEKA
ncbi:NERD domain-containing protein [Nocardioides sp. Y6]|uniref:NERD domain-containing protein n=1 Tax=Nocardioides malaquae TaxID=2773426 RepID=A0ABR9RU04_9ACTN|nr:NERD domain-containing protein [Nocardioides malaquae]MBE7325041.1 NERD domain-containing protein [Nocardioides malaquae]